MNLGGGKRKRSVECEGEEAEANGEAGIGCFDDCQGGEGLSTRGMARAHVGQHDHDGVDDARWLQSVSFMGGHDGHGEEEDGRQESLRHVLGQHHHQPGEGESKAEQHSHSDVTLAGTAVDLERRSVGEQQQQHHHHPRHCLGELAGGARPSQPDLTMGDGLGQDTYRFGDRGSLPMTASAATSGSVDSPSLVLNFTAAHSLAVHDHATQDHDQSALTNPHSPGHHDLGLLDHADQDSDPHHEELHNIHLDLNNLGDPPPTSSVFENPHRPHDQHVFAVEAMQELQQGDSKKRKGQWTEERMNELRDLVASRAQSTPNHRQSSNFWSDLTDSSKTLKIFTKEAIRMKARRLGLLNEDGTARATPIGYATTASFSSGSTAAAGAWRGSQKSKVRQQSRVRLLLRSHMCG